MNSSVLTACVLAAALITGCPSKNADSQAIRTASQTPRPKPTQQPTPLYEHRDHRELPVGTKIYYDGQRESMVRPGEPTPTGRLPDIIIIK